MKQYPEERKQAVLRRMMPPENTPVRVLSEETGISNVTGMPDHLHHWRKQARSGGKVVPGDGRNPENWSPQNKFAVVLGARECGTAYIDLIPTTNVQPYTPETYR
jgi:transposase